MEALLAYLKNKYHPSAMILYGSYARGSNGPCSDFDILVVSKENITVHDIDRVGDVQLDAFVYPEQVLASMTDYDPILQIHDGKVVYDEAGFGTELLTRVRYFISHMPEKSEADLRENLSWCVKTLRRAKKGTPSGDYRYHFLLVESLDIYCAVCRHAFLGPDGTLAWLESTDPEGYRLYCSAMHTVSPATLEAWIHHLLHRSGIPV